ncbi:uncharacterized protein LOC129751593 [Uranotaenia lowii]|uniref:uncharacterized protein LOC129751593 n=1 Tax=Uranotaenia lowii TaxID=190385 RepID=UPI00247A5634|nr:uncharacterized protein LOC129751593 [Uranotaenia lowii]
MKGPIIVDQLFHMVTTNFPEEQWFNMFKNPSDLKTFLKLFSDCFHIQSNLVTLLQKPKLSDSHIRQAQEKLNLSNSTFPSNTSIGSSGSTVGSTNGSSNTSRTASPKNMIGDFKLNEPVSVPIGPNNNSVCAALNNSNKGEPTSGFDSLLMNNDFRMENLCPKNCPDASASTYPSKQTPQQNSIKPDQLSAANEKANLVNNNSQAVNPKNLNISLKQRINSLVIKTLAENLEKDKQSMSAIHQTHQPAGTGQLNNNYVTPVANPVSPTPPGPVHSNDYFMGDTWKIKVLQNTKVVSTLKDSQFITANILKSAASGDGQSVLSFDCEGINLGIRGKITLIQLGTTDGEAFIFDITVCPEMVTQGGIKEVLESEKVIKVIHDCRNDSVNLFNQFSIQLRNVFDTQSAHAVLQFQDQGKQVYKVKNVSLNTLCEMYNATVNPMKDQLKNVYRRDQKFWSRRPLTRDMLLYAAGDVLILINKQLFLNMATSIKPEYRELLGELCTEQILMLIRPVDVKMRKKQRKVRSELQDLKVKLKGASKNVVLSNREIRLLRYMDLTEEEKEKLRVSYKVARKLDKLENFDRDRGDQSDSDDDCDVIEQDYQSLDSVPSDNSLPGTGGGPGTFSPKNCEPPSLTESMQLMDEILSNTTMDRMSKIDKLEAILSAATLLPNDQPAKKEDPIKSRSTKSTGTTTTSSVGVITGGGSKLSSRLQQQQHGLTPPPASVFHHAPRHHATETREAACQTLSTGDIVITKIFFKEEQDKKGEKTLMVSSKNGEMNAELQQQQHHQVHA